MGLVIGELNINQIINIAVISMLTAYNTGILLNWLLSNSSSLVNKWQTNN